VLHIGIRRVAPPWALRSVGSQGGNFPRGGGSPREPNPAGAGTGNKIPPWGRRGVAPNVYQGGGRGDFGPVELHGDPSSMEQHNWAHSPP
jgi:hypothetical protein